jgi:predicted peptidase
MRPHLLPSMLLALVCCAPCGAALAADPVIEEGIVYGKGGDVELQLDLARPGEGEGPFPAIVFIHGGGWSGGNRGVYRTQIEQAARRGYVAITVSYRLMTFDQANKETTTAEPIYPAQIHDVKAAVRWLRANAKKYHVDPNRIGATGASAGGHLSLLVGLTGPEDKLEGEGGHLDQSSRVQAVVNIFGPTEMASSFEKSSVAWIFRLFLGGTPEEAAERYKAASPVTYVGKGDPPVLTIHGDQDELVPVANARLLDETMKKAGASHTLLVLEGQGHGFQGAAAMTANAATWGFFEKHLKGEADEPNQANPGQQQGAQLERDRKVTMNYLIYLPKDYDQKESWPLLLFLHGAGERGDDLELVKVHGPPKLIAQGKEFPFIVVSPQCPDGKHWQAVELAALLDEICEKHKVDEDRIYVTGLSMGGFGTWALAAYQPERLAAILPICGGGERFWARNIAELPAWVFHGAKDEAVPLERSEQMVEALQKAGAEVKFTVYEDVAHDSWTQTYENPEVYEWLLQQKRE